MSQLVENYYDVILLDLHGVALTENPDSQGIGILEHVKSINPTQIVVAYSAQQWDLSTRNRLTQADAVVDKGVDYSKLKTTVDSLLTRGRTPGHYIAVMNAELGEAAADAPKVRAEGTSSFQYGERRRAKAIPQQDPD
jgi:hypothetical protein